MSSSFTVVVTLAWRNLWRNYRRTLIMLAAIVLGVWAMIFMTAIMRGMVDGIVTSGIKYLPGHAQIHHPAYRDDPSVELQVGVLTPELQTALNSSDIVGWSARVRVPAMISSERDSRGVMLLGVDPAQELSVSFDMKDLVEGRFLDSAGDRGVVVGEKMLERLETKVGRRIVLMSQTPDNEVGDRGFRIVGVYRADLESQEEMFVYAGRDIVQKMVGIPGVSEIAIQGPDYRNLSPWFEQLQAAVGEQQELKSWQELDGYMALVLTMQDSIGLVLTLIIFVVLSFGLVNTMAMAVFERVREIGLMLALGMRPVTILQQILVEAFYLLVLGLLLGNTLAWFSLQPLLDGIDLSFLAEGMEMYSINSVLYPSLKPVDMIQASVLVIILGVLASLLPAWRAARLNPIQALNEH
jgi:ABC-type lipoprotein release transport system permease subunit